MKKVGLFIIVILMMIIVFKPSKVNADGYKIGEVTPSIGLNIRTERRVEEETKICAIIQGTRVTILESKDGWYKVQLSDGTVGYCIDDYIKIVDKTENNKEEAETTTNNNTNNKGAAKAVELAKAQLGKQYVWGATGPNTFDCSGLTYWIASQCGISIPRTAQAQYDGLKIKVDKSNLRAGDLVYFHTSDRSNITHCGIMINSKEFIHASSPKNGVKENNINSDYYIKAYRGARRIF